MTSIRLLRPLMLMTRGYPLSTCEFVLLLFGMSLQANFNRRDESLNTTTTSQITEHIEEGTNNVLQQVSLQEHDACTTSVVGSDHRLSAELQHWEPADHRTLNDEEQVRLSWPHESSVEHVGTTIGGENKASETNLQEHASQSVVTTITKYDATDIKMSQCDPVDRCVVVQGGTQVVR